MEETFSWKITKQAAPLGEAAKLRKGMNDSIEHNIIIFLFRVVI